MVLMIFAVAAQAATQHVTAYGAVCNGVTDDSIAFANAIAAAYATGGGDVVTPAAKNCRVNSGVTIFSATQMDTAIGLVSDGAPTYLSCAACGTLLQIGANGYLTYNKQVRNIHLHLTASSASSATGVLLVNVIRPQFDNVTVSNGTNRASTTGFYFFNGGNAQGLCVFPGVPAGGICFGAHGVFTALHVNGYFTYGIRIHSGSAPVGGVTPNDSNNHHVFVGGELAGVPGSSQFGVYVEAADSNLFLNTDAEGFQYGYFLRGTANVVMGGRTEANSTKGVTMAATAGTVLGAIGNRVVGGSHPDGVDLAAAGPGGKNSTFEVNGSSGPESHPWQVRVISGAPGCSMSVGSTCTASVTLSPAFPSADYSAVCTVTALSGAPAVSHVANKTTTGFLVRMTATSGGGAVGNLDCTATHRGYAH